MLVKYPRTFHLPWSRSRTDDDKILKNVDHFIDKEVIVTEKMDGENSNLYRDYIHARSLDSKDHPSRHWVKQYHNTFKHNIPDGWRICGENLYAKHSLGYDTLPSYFLLFSIWNEDNYCLSWDDTANWAELLEIPIVPILYRGIWNEDVIKSLYPRKSEYGIESEGYVVRLANKFHYDEFKMSVAKFVRKNHVQTDQHWMHSEIIPNKLV